MTLKSMLVAFVSSEVRTGLSFTSFFLSFPKDAQASGQISWQGGVSVPMGAHWLLGCSFFIAWYRGNLSPLLHADLVVTHLDFQVCEW